MFVFAKNSLARQFMAISLFILLISMLVIGTWMGHQIEESVLKRTAVYSSLYVNSYVSHYLQGLSDADELTPEDIEALNQIISQTPLGQEIVSFKVWSADGRILYSSNPAMMNQQYEDNPELILSFAGEVTSDISDLTDPENRYERQEWDSLIEIYSPIWASDTGDIIAVSEFYQLPDALEAEILVAKQRSWLVVGGTTLITYLLLAGLVSRASNTIVAQQSELLEKATQNAHLHNQVRQAAAHSTALNERFLRRISTDLHDGPGQDLSLALLRIGSLAKSYQYHAIPEADRQEGMADFRRVHTALESALAELRHISAGLQSPEIETLSVLETIGQAIGNYERKTQCRVSLTIGSLPDKTPPSVKIALYRILQEALNNGHRHANGHGQAVLVEIEEDTLCIEVTDTGPGFDPNAVVRDGHLGLAGMRERAQVLGGHFSIESHPGRGTRTRACLPLIVPEVDNV